MWWVDILGFSFRLFLITLSLFALSPILMRISLYIGDDVYSYKIYQSFRLTSEQKGKQIGILELVNRLFLQGQNMKFLTYQNIIKHAQQLRIKNIKKLQPCPIILKMLDLVHLDLHCFTLNLKCMIVYLLLPALTLISYVPIIIFDAITTSFNVYQHWVVGWITHPIPSTAPNITNTQVNKVTWFINFVALLVHFQVRLSDYVITTAYTYFGSSYDGLVLIFHQFSIFSRQDDWYFLNFQHLFIEFFMHFLNLLLQFFVLF